MFKVAMHPLGAAGLWLAIGLAIAAAPSAFGQNPGTTPSAPGRSQPKAAPPAAKTPAAPPAKPFKGKNDETMTECLKLWDKGTHMSRQEWARTCRRIQSRLDNLKIENLKSMGIEPQGKGRGSAKRNANKPN